MHDPQNDSPHFTAADTVSAASIRHIFHSSLGALGGGLPDEASDAPGRAAKSLLRDAARDLARYYRLLVKETSTMAPYSTEEAGVLLWTLESVCTTSGTHLFAGIVAAVVGEAFAYEGWYGLSRPQATALLNRLRGMSFTEELALLTLCGRALRMKERGETSDPVATFRELAAGGFARNVYPGALAV